MKKCIKALVGAGCVTTAGIGIYNLYNYYLEKKLERLLEEDMEETEDDIPDFYEGEDGYDYEEDDEVFYTEGFEDADPVWAKLTLMDSAAINDCLSHIQEVHTDVEDTLAKVRDILDTKLTMTEKINTLNEILSKQKESWIEFQGAVMNVRRIIANRHCSDCGSECDNCKIDKREEK